jgi:hypothetical protein
MKRTELNGRDFVLRKRRSRAPSGLLDHFGKADPPIGCC